MNLIPVILSGGAGTRLWPVSRKSYPKPFMRLADGQSLMEKTLARASRLNPGGDILTVTGRDYFFITRDAYLGQDRVDSSRLHYLLEPVGRNTAPAIAMAAHLVRKRWGDQAVMIVLPADHLIEQDGAFGQAVDAAAALAEDGHLVTFGIEPDQPETGYGYIRKGQALGFGGYAIEQFVEKPELEIAERYLASGEYLWNSGMFCFSAASFIAALEQHQPQMADLARRCFEKTISDDYAVELDAKTFSQMPGISIDYAVMEKTSHAAVVPGNFGWNDIGSWKAISEIGDSDQRGNMVTGDAILLDTRDTYVQAGDRLVATIGVDNLLIIDSDDALLISDRERSQDVKAVVEQLRELRHTSLDFEQRQQGDWGERLPLFHDDHVRIEQVTLLCGYELDAPLERSGQTSWLVLEGCGELVRGAEHINLSENQVISAAPDVQWQIRNDHNHDLILIELQQ